MPDNLLIAVQARIGGTRFPGKVLAPLLSQPMLLWQLDRVSRLAIPHTLAVICPNTESNEQIQHLCKKHGYRCKLYDVPEEDVLARYVLAAEEFDAIEIVRLTGDCPLIDPGMLEQLIAHHRRLKKQRLDHTGIAPEWPNGQDAEVIAYNALDVAELEATLLSDREHVSPFIWRQPQRFSCQTFPCPFDLSAQGYSVDTPEDLRLVAGIAEYCLDRFGPSFTWRHIASALRSDPMLREMHAQRPPRNHAYTTQIAEEQQLDETPTWEQVRYRHG